MAFAEICAPRHSRSSRNPFHAGHVSRGFLVRAFAAACQVSRPPVRIRPICSASEGFYFQASNGSVALPVAGYNYNSDWTPLLAGLAPAGMAASLAAPEPYVRLSRIRLPPWVCDGKCLPYALQRLYTLIRLCVRPVLCWFAFPLVPALRSTDSAADCSALFAGFPATMARSDFSGPCIIGYGSSPSRCGPATAAPFRSDPRSPSFRCDPFARDVALDPGRASAPRIAVPHMLPSSE